MSEKGKPQVAKARKQSAGIRASGGRVPHIDFNTIAHGLLNPAAARLGNIGTKPTGYVKKALALVDRAERHARFIALA